MRNVFKRAEKLAVDNIHNFLRVSGLSGKQRERKRKRKRGKGRQMPHKPIDIETKRKWSADDALPMDIDVKPMLLVSHMDKS